MHLGLRTIAALALILPAAAATGSCSPQVQEPLAQEPVPPEVRAVIERSRNPATDYTSFHVDRVVGGNESSSSSAAEYHRGRLHRIETTALRMIVNCETGATVAYEVRAERFGRPSLLSGLCGIPEVEPVISSRLLPAETGRFGPVDVVELTGPEFIRRYAVTRDGILTSSNFTQRRADVRPRVEIVRARISRGSPDPAMFEEASLARAFAPPPEQLIAHVNGVQTP